MLDDFPFKKEFHVIFCRNVMIYFDYDAKMNILEKFYKFLEPGGYLFIGHSESINVNESEFKYVMRLHIETELTGIYFKAIDVSFKVRGLYVGRTRDNLRYVG